MYQQQQQQQHVAESYMQQQLSPSNPHKDIYSAYYDAYPSSYDASSAYQQGYSTSASLYYNNPSYQMAAYHHQQQYQQQQHQHQQQDPSKYYTQHQLSASLYDPSLYAQSSNFVAQPTSPQLVDKSVAMPQPIAQTVEQLSEQQTITPKKPIMDDSGIELISPQLSAASSSLSSIQQSQTPASAIPTMPQHSSPLYACHNINTDSSSNSSDASVNCSHNQSNNVHRQEDDSAANENDDDEEDGSDSEEDTNDEDDQIEETPKASNKTDASKQSNNSATPSKPPKPYLEIIADAVLSCQPKMMQLHEIYHFMEQKYAYFAKNVNKSWRNSVRHNLSLNECFVKAGRGSNGKGNYWRIHPLCEKEFIRGNFRRKSFKQLIRAGNANKQQQQQQQQQHALSHASAAYHPSSATFSYNVPFDLNSYRTIPSSLVPPPLPQHFTSAGSTLSPSLASFQYPFLNQRLNVNEHSPQQHHELYQQQHQHTQSEQTTAPSKCLSQSSSSKSHHRFQPY